MIAASISTPVHNVALGEDANQAGGFFNPNVEAEFPQATIGRACRGDYQLGLSTRLDDVLRVYRAFHLKGTVDECVAEGVNVDKDNTGCWDSWRVVVKDSNGKVVATSDD